MRIVRYDSQERVDLPDITAMSFLVLGEFRRHVRGLLLGPDPSALTSWESFIIRGFAVEPQAVPDATIRVRLDPGGGSPLGFAIGAENLGSRIDTGQLVGGNDMNGQLEGNAQQTLDFSGQPVGNYTVQMRFVYQEGTNDNRAFWDEAANSEFIAATDTRHLPVYELRFSGAPSAEWIDLAQVAWGGATIGAGDITDLRTFALEGSSPFQQATQGGSGGIADFSRSTDRAANGTNEVYPFMRGLARQVQDIKGQDDAGQFNWFARPFRAFEDTNSQPFSTASQTKTLRTLDTVTYTIGDGVTTFGDFNGADGLEDCLQHLEDLGAQVPLDVTILLRSHNAATPGFSWNINSGHQLNSPCSVRIIGLAGGFDRRATIAIGAAVASTALVLTDGMLELRNISVASAPANNVAIFGSLEQILVDNCQIVGRSDSAAAAPALFGQAIGSYIRNSEITGKLFIYGIDPAAAQPRQEGFLIDGLFLNDGCIECEDAFDGQVTGLDIRNSRISMQKAHAWGLRGAVDLKGSLGVRISSSWISFIPDVDGVHARTTANNVPGDIVVHGCAFFTEVTNPVHAVGAGSNGALGTGWGVYVEGTATGNRRAFSVRVADCRVIGYTNSVDGGGVKLYEVRDWHVSGLDVQFGGHLTAGGTETFTSIAVAATANNFDTKGAIEGCTIHRWDGFGGGVRTRGVQLVNVDNVKVASCSFFGDDDAGGAITGRGASHVAVYVEDGFYVGISNCHFEAWEEDTANSRCIVSNGDVRYLNIVGCTFRDNGGFAVDIDGVDYGSISANTLHVSLTNGQGFQVTTCPGMVVNDNSFHFQTATQLAIDFGSASNNVAMGNRAINGDIRVTAGTVRGYNEVGQDLNLVNAYV